MRKLNFMYAITFGLATLSSNFFVNAQTKGHFSEKRLKVDTSKAGYDGPYIFYTEQEATVKQILEKNNEAFAKVETFKNPIAGKKIKCYVDDKESFTFKVQELLQNQPSVYQMPEKLIAISDIEGNYHQFKEFLINNKVMDKNYKWTFGKGHLVTVGDFFDRGLLVNQTLWLIYSLEEQAEKAGGKVHFILGNHDLMNMNNDFRYVRKKYLEDAKLMNQEYYDFYKPNTELGRWLGTKNIMEKIGDYIFVHAGISKEVSDLNMGVEGINKYARGYYFNNLEAKLGADPVGKTIYMFGKSPMWYRGYGKETIDRAEFASIAKNMDAKKFVIGHTLHESVTYLMDKQVIDLDVLHVKGTTQGLLIENGQEFTVDINGNKSVIKERAKEVDDD